MLAAAVALSFAVVLAATIGVGELLAKAERPDGSTGFDRSITSWFVDHRASWLTTVARALSTIGSQKVLIPLVAVVAIVLVVRRALKPALLLVVLWAITYFLSNIFIKNWLRLRERSHASA